MMFTEKDTEQITAHQLTSERVQAQLESFKQGFDPLPVIEPAVVANGITQLSEEKVKRLTEHYDKATTGRVVKFVPASGAATRMFKDLFEYVNEDKKSKQIEQLLEQLSDFAFYDELLKYVTPQSDPHKIIDAIINKGLHYGAKPKGQILFHKYPLENRTAVEEHLVEGASYARSGANVNIHFTVSPEHQAGFEELIGRVLEKYEDRFGVHYNISYSQQKSSTDTIAVNLDNTPFRNADGSLLFRPAGHGALIENLGAIDADIIFVKNIDNITTDRLRENTTTYKKVLAAILLDIQSQTFSLLRELDGGANNELTTKIETFVTSTLCFKLPKTYDALASEKKVAYLRSVLDRPIRICGMVRNDGEPGGGPFWVERKDGAQSLQIAESSQIAPDKAHLMKSATHFNPVDLVCGVKNYKGQKFDLTKYVDASTCFISNKSKDGRDLKAMELPGLWNGAMADRNTIFVETPLSTFTPVKVVTDLLREQHR